MFVLKGSIGLLMIGNVIILLPSAYFSIVLGQYAPTLITVLISVLFWIAFWSVVRTWLNDRNKTDTDGDETGERE